MALPVSPPEQVLGEIHGYADHEDDITAVLANIAGVLKAHRPHYTWVGFYLFGRGSER